MTRIVLALALILTAANATAQDTFKPRGAPAPAVTPAPAPTAAPDPTTTSAAATPEPAAEPPAEYVTMERFNTVVSSLSNRLSVLETTKEVADAPEQQEEPAAPSDSGWGLYWVYLVSLLAIAVFVTWLLRRRGNAAHHRATPVVLLALGLGFASTASAQTPPAAPAQTCIIRGIAPAVVTKEQDPITVTISVRGCSEVKSVALATGATGVTFTVDNSTPARVTAKVTAEASHPEGGEAIKITLADGTEVVSPNSVFLLVINGADYNIRREAAAANARVARDVNALKTQITTAAQATDKNVADLRSRLDAVASERLTEPEVQVLITEALKPLQGKVADLEMLATYLREKSNGDSARITALAQATVDLAAGQTALGNTVVKKGGFFGFGGNKPLDPGVAEAAERVQQATIAAMQAP